jgi:transglutaminase-like putative cysteine protease
MTMNRHTSRWILAAIALATLPHLAHMPKWLGLILALVFAWRWLKNSDNYQPPHIVARVVITIVGVAAVLMAHGTIIGRRAATTLLTVMLVLKLLELVKLRDGRLIVSTSFFLTATYFLFNQDLIFLPWMLACAITGIAALRLLQENSLQLITKDSSIDFKHIKPQLQTAGRLLLMAIPVTLALFIFFPRLSTPLWGLPEYALDGKSGLSDRMTPGRIQQMFLDDSPAFRASFNGAPPPQGELYWRGPVLWNFDGNTWTQGNMEHAERHQIPPPREAKWWYEVQLEPHEQHWLFALDYPTRWPRGSFVTHDHQLVTREPVTSLTRYEISTAPDFKDLPNELPFHSQYRALRLPKERNSRTTEMMLDWRAEYQDDQELVQKTLNYFREQEFFYSLEAPPLGINGVDEFLFDLRVGYCEYYASAFVVMMRAADIPARVVTGYLGGEYNSVGNYLLVRQSDAHAWAEVWLEGQGWTRVDPTAMVSPERVEYGASAAVDYNRGWQDWSWVRHFQTSIDAVRNLWNQWVLSFDSRRQQRLFNPLGFGQLKHQHLIILLVVLLTAGGFILHFLLQRQALHNKEEAVRLYRRALRRLKPLGLRKDSHEGPFEFAERIQPHLSNAGAEWMLITQDYYQIRYAGKNDRIESLRQRCLRFRPKLAMEPESKTASV